MDQIKNEIAPKKAVFNWSGGKDSALALYKVLQDKEYEVVALLTTVNCRTKRSSVHGIPFELLKEQARSIGIPFYPVFLGHEGELDGYALAIEKAAYHFKSKGVSHFIFGDILINNGYMQNVREYREKQFAPAGISVVEPLWNKTQVEIIEEFFASGLQTIIVTTMADKLDASYIGKKIDRDLIDNLPEGVDICGEEGEYHTFCYDGAIYSFPIDYIISEPKYRANMVPMSDGTEKEFTYYYGVLTKNENLTLDKIVF